MTDTTETIVTPDPHAIARAVLLEVAGESDQVGISLPHMILRITSLTSASPRISVATKDGNGR